MQAGSKVGGTPAAEGIQNPVAWLGMGQVPDRKVEREHGEVGAQSIEA